MREENDAEAVHDAMRVLLAQREIDGAISALASRPLDDDTAEQMRATLASPHLAEARAALRRLSHLDRPSRPTLRVVTNPEEGQA